MNEPQQVKSGTRTVPQVRLRFSDIPPAVGRSMRRSLLAGEFYGSRL
jgi:hypothetical protein